MKRGLLTWCAVLAVVVATGVGFALLENVNIWEKQKAAKLTDFAAAERQVEAMRRDARDAPGDDAKMMQLERAVSGLQIARLSLILFFITKPFPFTAEEAEQVARWQEEAAAYRASHPLPSSTPPLGPSLARASGNLRPTSCFGWTT